MHSEVQERRRKDTVSLRAPSTDPGVQKAPINANEPLKEEGL